MSSPTSTYASATGFTLSGLTEALSTAITTVLQAGAPPSEIVAPLRHPHYTFSGATADPDVPHATSLSDYLAHRLHQQHTNTAPPHPDAAQLPGDIRTSTQPQLPTASWVPHPPQLTRPRSTRTCWK
ncbi:TSCPD domain-containing protein [Micromonospora sp. CPCC 205558]|uniref:TSCPD domain-containing protein n=1 Tax=Micromonospora sp. CPCC 205558 TaxID=3122403 RepID=UPI003FA56E46